MNAIAAKRSRFAYNAPAHDGQTQNQKISQRGSISNMKFQPHVTVATVVERDRRFLLVEEWAQGRLVYNQPAGHLEQGETLAQAAKRETLEETGWLVEMRAALGISLYTPPTNGVCYVRHSFYAEPLERCREDLDTGIVRAVWMSLDDMLAQQVRMRSPLVLATVRRHIEGHHYPLELFY